jgi:5-methyltetrahydropteroyltriglutamate--homocysteine methyltransferase
VADDFKYHIDHHAGLVPPPALSDVAGDEAALRAAEDAAVTAALRTQRRLGLSALSDGEFRRRNHLAAVYDAVAGFGPPVSAGPLARLVGQRHAPEIRVLTEPPAERGRLVKHETDFVLAVVQRPVMVALPSPGYLAELTAAPGARPVAVEAAGSALARIVRDEIAAVAADGVRYVLLTNPAYGFLLSAAGRSRAGEFGLDPAFVVARMVEADSQVLAGLEVPGEFRVGLDLTTAGAVAGNWERSAVSDFARRQPFGRLCVEYPADLSGRFPLDALPGAVVASLGVVDVSDGTLEDVEELVARIDAAAEIVDIDDIAIATNGSFRAAAGPVDEAVQHAKLQRVEMVARYFWGNEL